MTSTAPRVEPITTDDDARDEADVSPASGRPMFEDVACRYLGISGEEFIRRWDAGDYVAIADSADHWYVGFLGALLPVARVAARDASATGTAACVEPAPASDGSSRSDDDDLPPIYYVTPEEDRLLFDQAVRKQMGMSGEEFIARWEAGEYDATFDKAGYRHIDDLASLIPFCPDRQRRCSEGRNHDRHGPTRRTRR